MSSPVAELEAGLLAMSSLKPPGVSGSRIQSITALCTANVQSESVLVQKLYTHFRKAPGTHKLGVLYVVDSVARKWTEQAKSAGQPINSSAQDGSFAAGVHRVKELLPALMNDIIYSSPDDQKEKIKKLIDIWEKGQTFPLQMLTSFKEKLNSLSPNNSTTTTPPGSPPADLQKTLMGLQLMQPKALGPAAAGAAAVASSAPAPAPNTSSILAALANMARQNQNSGGAAAGPAAAAAAPLPLPIHNGQLQDNLYNVSSGQNNVHQQVPAMNHQNLPFLSMPPSVNVPTPAANFAPQQLQGMINGTQNFANNQPNLPAAMSSTVSPNALNPAMQQQLMLAKALADSGMPHDKIIGIIAAMGTQGVPLAGAGAGGLPPPPPQFSALNQNTNAQNGWPSRPAESRDRIGNGNGYHEAVRSPQDRYGRRSRSRSPDHGWNARDSPNSRRRDESMPDYERNSPGRNRGDDRGRGQGRAGRGNGNDYRQRSPQYRQSLTPPFGGPKWVGYDDSIGKGNIKVLSRTLFVGGVTGSDHELRHAFNRHGQVQTCIVNKDKRHAFVKMVSRADAVTAKEAMEKPKDSQLRTRWGVGFGPRDCSDYHTGVSIIPISKLTDADRKWMLNAEYGGSGGKPIEPGMVVEEPDIEIGQGVSSKAISRRMQTDKGGHNGPKSSRDRENEDEHKSRRGENRDNYNHNHRGNDRKDRFPVASGPPAMPAIPPFSIPGFPPFSMPSMPNGMPMLPPGYMYPAQAQAKQGPPPGRRD